MQNSHQDDAVKMWEDAFKGEKAPDVAEEKWRKTSLDGGKGEVISIAWSLGEKIHVKFRAQSNSELCLLSDTFSDIREALNGRPPFFVGHNIPFDLKFLFHRSVILGLDPIFKLPFAGRHDSDYFDNMQAWAGFREFISQDNLCKALGIEGKPDDITGSNVWDFVKAGDVERVAEYNKDDVDKVIKIYNKINFKG